jgi:hypothetical protein
MIGSVIPPETPFRFECDMLNPLIKSLPAVFRARSGQRLKVLREPTIGSVIPDILVGIWSGDLPRWSNLNSVSRHVLAWLSTQKVASGEQQLREVLLISEHAAVAAMSALKRVGAIAKKESGEVELRPEFDVSHAVKLIAIEVKLRRWREALDQAITYREFADEAYVVLDGNQVRFDADIRAAFASNGIGLFLQRGTEVKRKVAAVSGAKPSPSDDRLFALGKLANSSPYCLA